MESNTSVRTLSALPESWICGPYPGIFTLGISCADVRTTVSVIEVELQGDQLVPSNRSTSTQRSRLDTAQKTRPDTSNWTLYTCPGRDRYEQNLEVFRSHGSGEAYLRTVREIREGEELFVWYSEELARELSIPILTPANIQGNLEYVCTACSASFQYPNPLKAHIRFHCQHSDKRCAESLVRPATADLQPRRPSTERVLRVSSAASVASRDSPFETLISQQQAEKSALLFHPAVSNRLNSSPYHSRFPGDLTRPDLLALNYMSQLLMPPDPHRIAVFPQLRLPFFPAFVPYGALPPVIPFKDQGVLSERVVYPPVRASKNSGDDLTGNYDVLPSTHAIDVELHENGDEMPRMIYMNGRKSKRGYLCVYCGKLYSRKYGLKIHVRTHTGFKPLKCKVCLRPFGDPSNLNKHIRLHAEGDTPYRCHHCGKVLVRRRDLERHIRSRHSNEAVTFLDNMSDDNATAVTSSVSLLDEQDVDVEDAEQVDVI